MITPQLRKLIDDINKRSRKQVSYVYKDGHKSTLTVTESGISITTDNPDLLRVLGLMMEKILSGQFKPIDKSQ